MNLTPGGRLKRKIVKRLIYSMLSFRDGILVLLGRGKSYVRFTVEADPPSVFYNFRIRPDRLEAFKKHLDLPPGFTFDKIRFFEDDRESRYYVSLNVYLVSGITNAMRAEWSVYARNANESPSVIRCVVAEAQSSEITMDPVNIFERARRVKQTLNGTQLKTYAASFNHTAFQATCRVPEDITTLPSSCASREWLKAIDLIYWLNGIGDRTFFDGSMTTNKIYLLSPEAVQIQDNTQWSEFVEPLSDPVMIFPEAIEFVMSPWWNV